MSKNFLPIGIGIVLLVIVGGIFVLSQNKAPNGGAHQIILFFGETCPHCLNVEQFLQANNVEQKISFEKKEVYNNRANADLLASKARECGINDRQIGVPFLYANGRCLVGEEEVINFFQEKIK